MRSCLDYGNWYSAMAIAFPEMLFLEGIKISISDKGQNPLIKAEKNKKAEGKSI